MKRAFLRGVSGLVACLLLSVAALAGGHNPADFPLRVHIYQHNGVSHYSRGTLDYVDGEGRANLFENGEPRAFEYGYRCGDRLRNSDGYETYMARWKKKDRRLEILLPVMGKPNAAETCELKVEMKADVVYVRHNGSLNEAPAAKYKEWMDKHQYDPEHGKNVPVAPESTPAPAQTPAATGAAGIGTSAPK
jgi:hypothetical protein